MCFVFFRSGVFCVFSGQVCFSGQVVRRVLCFSGQVVFCVFSGQVCFVFFRFSGIVVCFCLRDVLAGTFPPKTEAE